MNINYFVGSILIQKINSIELMLPIKLGRNDAKKASSLQIIMSMIHQSNIIHYGIVLIIANLALIKNQFLLGNIFITIFRQNLIGIIRLMTIHI
uniref:Uncharacterized protein n=1 Tax=Acrobeloides nanus TaxID=290746 RepID=A0A914DKT9_9BILA